MERVERDPSDLALAWILGSARRSDGARGARDGGREASRCTVASCLENGDLWLERGEHVRWSGPTARAKTTLIEAIAGLRALEGGRAKTGHNVKLGLSHQHAEELGMRGTALEAAQRATGLTPNKARALLGHFLFSARG